MKNTATLANGLNFIATPNESTIHKSININHGCKSSLKKQTQKGPPKRAPCCHIKQKATLPSYLYTLFARFCSSLRGPLAVLLPFEQYLGT